MRSLARRRPRHRGVDSFHRRRRPPRPVLSLARAVEHARTRGLDHLAVAPDTAHAGRSPSTLFASGFALLFAQFTRPVAGKRPALPAPHRDRCLQPGAGRSLPRGRWARDRSACARTTTCAWGRFSRRPVTGRISRSEASEVVVEWYSSFREAVQRGLEKNTFAGVDYSLPRKHLLSGFSLATPRPLSGRGAGTWEMGRCARRRGDHLPLHYR
jgi:hypothetical protein